MSRYAVDEYYNHEGYKDVTAHQAITNISKAERGGKKVLKIRIMFTKKDKAQLDRVINAIEKEFQELDVSKSKEYKNTRKDTAFSRVYVDVIDK